MKFPTTAHRIALRTQSKKPDVVSAENVEDNLEEMEPKVRQQIRIVGRTIFCFRCDGSKEMASYYCACGSFLCIIHLAEHSCLVSASMQYNEELLRALC